jgi:hypothetical protein
MPTMITRAFALTILAVTGLPLAAQAQAPSRAPPPAARPAGPPPTAPAAAAPAREAPALPQAERTTASYGDWVLGCGQPAGGERRPDPGHTPQGQPLVHLAARRDAAAAVLAVREPLYGLLRLFPFGAAAG